MFLTLSLSAQVIFPPSFGLEAAVGLACTTAIIAMTVGVVWLLVTQVRDFAADESEAQAAAAGEEAALLERKGAANAQRKKRGLLGRIFWWTK